MILIPIMLKPYLPFNIETRKKSPMINVLITAPEKLKINPGDMNVPVINELRIVRRIVISMAYLKPSITMAVIVRILANPSRRPGIGWGIRDSEIWRTQARATKRAIFVLLFGESFILCSFLVSIDDCINIRGIRGFDFNENFIGQTDDFFTWKIYPPHMYTCLS